MVISDISSQRAIAATIVGFTTAMLLLVGNATADESIRYHDAQASCDAQILAKLERENPEDPVDQKYVVKSPEGQARVAVCVALNGFPAEAYKNALAALSAGGDQQDAGILAAIADIAKIKGDHAAYVHFSHLEAGADHHNAVDARHADLKASEDAAAYLKATDVTLCNATSEDERTVCEDEGAPDHVETFTTTGQSAVTWWYGAPTYRKAYTFTNGVLTSTFKP